jgi:hypothetical protein
MSAERPGCNATHAAGLVCDRDADHDPALHRHGAFAGRVVYWSDGEGDVQTRAELAVELGALVAAGVAIDGEDRMDRNAFDAARYQDPARRPPPADAAGRLVARAVAILQTLEPVPPQARVQAETTRAMRPGVRWRGADEAPRPAPAPYVLPAPPEPPCHGTSTNLTCPGPIAWRCGCAGCLTLAPFQRAHVCDGPDHRAIATRRHAARRSGATPQWQGYERT